MIEKIWAKIKRISVLRSFRVRIFLLMLIIGILPSIIVRNGILSNYETRAVNVKISEVQNQFKIIANHLITYNYLQDTSSSEVINAELGQLSNLYDGRVLIINGNIKSCEVEVIPSVSSLTTSEHIPKGIIPTVENTENIITTSASHNKITA